MPKIPHSPHGQPSTLNAKQVSDRLGMHVTSVYRLRNKLGGIYTDKGWAWPTGRIEALAAERIARFKLNGENAVLTGDVAKLIFTALREGKSAELIVIEHALSPNIVRAGIQEYAKLRACIFLTTDHLEAIYALPLTGVIPCVDANELIFVLQQSIGPLEMCTRCKKRPAPKMCDACMNVVRKARAKETVRAV